MDSLEQPPIDWAVLFKSIIFGGFIRSVDFDGLLEILDVAFLTVVVLGG